VKVSQIPSFFQTVVVHCGFAPVNIGSPEANYSAAAPPVNGAFDGILKVSISVFRTPANQITGYTCDLWLAGGDYLEPAAATDLSPAAHYAQPKAGTVFIGHVKGNF
jgi:hypothetical protein